MSDLLAPIATRLATFVRLLSSDKEGEIVAAARAINRTLRDVGTDIHILAEHIENSNDCDLTEAEMRKLYDAGYSDGRRDAENKQFGSTDFRNVDGTPYWHQLALYCQQQGNLLRSKEPTFVNDMAARTVWCEPTVKQGKWLLSIFLRLGGRL